MFSKKKDQLPHGGQSHELTEKQKQDQFEKGNRAAAKEEPDTTTALGALADEHGANAVAPTPEEQPENPLEGADPRTAEPYLGEPAQDPGLGTQSVEPGTDEALLLNTADAATPAEAYEAAMVDNNTGPTYRQTDSVSSASEEALLGTLKDFRDQHSTGLPQLLEGHLEGMITQLSEFIRAKKGV